MDIDVIARKVNLFEEKFKVLEASAAVIEPEFIKELLALKEDLFDGLKALQPALDDLADVHKLAEDFETKLQAAFNGLKANVEDTNVRVANLELAAKGETEAPEEAPPVADVEDAPKEPEAPKEAPETPPVT